VYEYNSILFIIADAHRYGLLTTAPKNVRCSYEPTLGNTAISIYFELQGESPLLVWYVQEVRTGTELFGYQEGCEFASETLEPWFTELAKKIAAANGRENEAKQVEHKRKMDVYRNHFSKKLSQE